VTVEVDVRRQAEERVRSRGYLLETLRVRSTVTVGEIGGVIVDDKAVGTDDRAYGREVGAVLRSDKGS
jgi:hypothetical protein